jgi:hypothetical protein
LPLADDKQTGDLSHCKPLSERAVLVAKEDKYSISAPDVKAGEASNRRAEDRLEKSKSKSEHSTA